MSIPEPTTFNGPDTRPMPSNDEHEDIRERDTAYLYAIAREFVQAHGAKAMLRCVADALDSQQELFR